MTDRGELAITEARDEHNAGVTFGVGLCLQRVRLCYHVDSKYPDAASAWRNAAHRHPQVDPAQIPRGVPVFWTGGSAGHGHIAIATGDGECWSTDILRGGHWDKVPIGLIRRRWGLTLVGWTEDLNGVRVYDPTNQEDDMTPEELWKYQVKAGGDRYASVLLAQTWNRVAAIESAIKALAAGISPTVEAAVKEALADAVVDVDVNVNNRTGA